MEERQKARRQARAKERQRKRAADSRAKAHKEHSGSDSAATSHNLNIFDNNDEPDPPPHDTSHFPPWSWDTVRPWVILRRDTSYPDDQILQIARHDVFVVEKMTGWKCHGSNEAGSLAAARRVKKLNPKIKTFFYLNAVVHYPGYDANTSFQDEWAVREKATSDDDKVFLFKDRYMLYDHTHSELREWWIQRALDMVSHDEMDGVFIDAIIKTSNPHLGGVHNARAYFDTAVERGTKETSARGRSIDRECAPSAHEQQCRRIR